ncbi:glycerophosphocholine phosphodiesterase GPCPD1-like [Lucilia sericata]|uniref:glycerophosphocholine phosphodiesterase GPCPD1-like n=1 Tax=Lucilia sericata TaxID=13632 RepID=UPI0018A7EF93|nr:glycerophosphocholine phosphodiesterase GPCPD1-like [Lucilia sericata]
MHRWFFADDEIVCKDLTPPSSPPETPKTSSSSSLLETEWIFKVKFDWELCSNETLAISGSCPILGTWDVQHSVPLNRDENSSCWTLTVTLPRKYDIHYRYLVCALNARGQRIVRFWETHCEARLISRYQMQDIESLECETFGIYKDKIKLERGWINPYSTVVQFKFYQDPFVLKHTIINSPLYVKITPLKIKDREKCEGKTSLETQLLTESLDKDLTQTFAYCEVASLQDQNGEFYKQAKYGTACGCEDIIIFNLTLGDIEHTAYQLDLFNYSSKSAPDVPPHHFGYQYVLPQDMKGSEGTLYLTIMCGTKHRPIGSMKCDYLIVRPMHSNDFNMEKTFQRHWNIKHEGIFVGHRGCGRSYWFQNNILRENTINSFNLAFAHGADMVEFDVQLTKDMIPIVYHDFQLYISKNLDIDLQEYDVMHLPLTPKEMESLKKLRKTTEELVGISVSKFTLDQLRRVKVYEPAKENVTRTSCGLNKKHNRPFMTLERVLIEVNNKIGYIIEIKWPQKLADGILADFDKNEFVDTILQVVFQKAGSRRIVFSSFDADICTMVRLKQNLYPILLMIRDNLSKDRYLDPRSTSILSGTYFANAMELLGIIVNCADIFEMPGKVSDIHERDLCVFSWGEENRKEKTRKYLKTLGVDGIICDRINHCLEPVDLKRNIFVIDLVDKISENNRICSA